MEPAVEAWKSVRRVGLVGASRSGKKFGNIALKELRSRGCEVLPVHPEAEALSGAACAKSVAALAGKVDGLVVCVPPSKGEAVLREAAAAGIGRVWLQQGAESPELMKLAAELKLEAVGGRCILMFAEPVRSAHRLHRGLLKLFGKFK